MQRSVPDRRRGEDEGSNPEHLPAFRISYSEPVAPGRPAPDVLMDFNQAAYVCGLGSMGLGSFFLTDSFGPLQRFAFVLTDAELEPDPVQETPLCDNCGECIRSCPVNALSASGLLDEWQCMAGRMGASYSQNPFLTQELLNSFPGTEEYIKGDARFNEEAIATCSDVLESAYPQVRFGYNPSLCGAACQRTCLAHLENKGVLKKTFVNPFRDHDSWKIEE